ncbi:MAG: NAD(P)H-hydrate dehydratase [Halobacteria archaeon]
MASQPQAEITSREMAALDANCEFYGLSRLQLMENAGAAVARRIRARFPKPKPVVVLCGPGNNGGDGFVAARKLLASGRGYKVRVLLLVPPKDLRTPEARKNYDALVNAGVTVEPVSNPKDLPDLGGSVVVDALFGTGVRGTIREPHATAMRLMNSARRRGGFVVAVDVPSGVDPDTGKAGLKVEADLVVTFHRRKPGIRRFRGEVAVADIGIPEGMEHLTGPGDLLLLPERSRASHKGMNGRVLVVGGGPYHGAPALAGLAALRAGADVATVAVPEAIESAVRKVSPNLQVVGLPGKVLGPQHLPAILQWLKRHDILSIGSGLGRDPGSLKTARALLRRARKAVVDGEALVPGLVRGRFILTPHTGEISRLLGRKVSLTDSAGRLKAAREAHRRTGAAVLLKGPEDVIVDGERWKVNRIHNSGMTVGGTGDVLAGVCAAFYAKVADPFHAACAAAYVSGAAGNLALEEMGYGFLATDVARKIPHAIREAKNGT